MSERKNKHRSSPNQDAENIKNLIFDDEDKGSGSGGVASGEIEKRWVDPLTARTRENLPPQEKKRLQQVHEFANKILVDKQKNKIEERKLLKEGKRPAQAAHTKGFGNGRGGMQSRYKEHPIAKRMAGKMDPQVSLLASENEADTNAELKEANELKHQHKLQNRLQYSHTPKLRPY